MPRANVTLIPNEENLSNLLEVIDLVLKKCEHRSKFHDAYYFNATTFKKTATLGKRSEKIINDCLGSHHFDDAAKLLWVMCQDRNCFDTLLYKGVMVVLENIQLNDKDETVMKFLCGIHALGRNTLINKQDVHLEYILYALRNNVPDIEGCYEKVTHKQQAERKKIPGIDLVLTAYFAVLDYIAWRNCCQDDLSAEAIAYVGKATLGFQSIVEHPGTWDIFILKYIEMLEHYKKHKDIEEILKKYVECNPQHINAYIYICVHLHKSNKDPELFIQYAKVLAELCPSDVRVLLLVETWSKLGMKLKERLKILFMFLDYPSNGKNILGWRMLSSHLLEVIRQKTNLDEFVKSEWKFRYYAWRNMHFNPSNILPEFVVDPVLITYKIKVLAALQPDHEYIKKASKKLPHLFELNSSYNGDATTEDYETFYRLDDNTNTRNCL